MQVNGWLEWKMPENTKLHPTIRQKNIVIFAARRELTSVILTTSIRTRTPHKVLHGIWRPRAAWPPRLRWRRTSHVLPPNTEGEGRAWKGHRSGEWWCHTVWHRCDPLSGQCTRSGDLDCTGNPCRWCLDLSDYNTMSSRWRWWWWWWWWWWNSHSY